MVTFFAGVLIGAVVGVLMVIGLMVWSEKEDEE